MDKFRQISTELWPLIHVINCFFTLFFKMIFFALKIFHGGMLHACSAFIQLWSPCICIPCIFLILYMYDTDIFKRFMKKSNAEKKIFLINLQHFKLAIFGSFHT